MKTTSAAATASPAGYKIAAVSTHPFANFALRAIVEDEIAGAEVIHYDDDIRGFANMASEVKPDCLLLHIGELDAESWRGNIRTSLRILPDLDIVVIADQTNTRTLYTAYEAGVRGVVGSSDCDVELPKAIAAIRCGNYWMHGQGSTRNLASILASLKQQTAAIKAPADIFGLTPRELEVINMIADGRTNPDIARTWKISEETVKRHLANIFDKMGVSSRLELALFAIAHRLVPAPTAVAAA